jgi:hypothetical protein
MHRYLFMMFPHFDAIEYGYEEWPSHSIWMVPGTQLED